jgi:type IV pilus assembly protein PilY1
MKAKALASLLTLLIAIALPAGRAGGEAGDLDLLATSVPPNVMILLDSSGSMGNLPTSGGTDSKMVIAKDVVLRLLDDINPAGQPERVRFGLARFNGNDGGTILVPIGSGNKAAMQTGVNGISPGGRTPVSEALVDVGRYFASGYTMGDYPAASAFSNPLDVDCRASFVIVVTDGIPVHDQHERPSQAPFHTTIGNYDCDLGECSSSDPNVLPVGVLDACACVDNPSKGLSDATGSDYLDDVAAYLFDTDLHPGHPGKQNLVTYTVGFDLAHPLLSDAAAAGNGDYFTSNDATALFADMQEAILDIILRSASFTSATVPSSRSRMGDGFYFASFEPGGSDGFWEGHLEAFRLDLDGNVIDTNGNLAIDASTGRFIDPRYPFWDAGEVIKTMGSRTLYTTISGARTDFDVPSIMTALGSADPNDVATFIGLDPSDPNTASEITTYPNYPASGVTTALELTAAIGEYMYGKDAFDQDGDASTTDARGEVLGDIFHSSPILIGPPSNFLILEDGFGTTSNSDPPFHQQYATRDRVLYAGANDGMLHAFEAGQHNTGDDPNTASITETEYYDLGTGEERFGWVPGMLMDTIRFIPKNDPRTHFYVDGTPAAADAWFRDPNDANDVTKEPAEWTTVLVVGMRRGDRGYLALDVTNPDGTASGDPHGPYPRLLWELTDATATQLGESWSEPIITRVKTTGPSGVGDHCGDDDGDGDCRERWVAIVGGGYTEEGNPNSLSFNASSLAGKAIYMIALDTGAVLASVEYDPADVTGPDEMQYAIPSTPSVLDINFDGFADVVYIGDLGGQVWKWDVSAVASDTVGDSRFDNFPADIFFTAPIEDMGGGAYHYQSFFFAPSATFVGGTLVLAFGAGERADLRYPGDSTLDENNRFYVIKDPHPIGASAFSTTYGESDLTDITGADQDTDSTDSGFFMVATDAEKFITNPSIFAGFVITSSYIPDLSGTSICFRTGESFLYVFDIRTGLGAYFDSGVTTGDDARRLSIGSGVSSDPQISMSRSGNQLYIQTSSGRVVQTPPPLPNTPPVDMIYWKQNF